MKYCFVYSKSLSSSDEFVAVYSKNTRKNTQFSLLKTYLKKYMEYMICNVFRLRWYDFSMNLKVNEVEQIVMKKYI